MTAPSPDQINAAMVRIVAALREHWPDTNFLVDTDADVETRFREVAIYGEARREAFDLTLDALPGGVYATTTEELEQGTTTIVDSLAREATELLAGFVSARGEKT